MTVLIPCGVTQAMMAVAIASGSRGDRRHDMSPSHSARRPVFFTLAYLATRLGQHLEKGFMIAVAAVVLVLGLVSIDSGLTVSGCPYSFTDLRMAIAGAQRPPGLRPPRPLGGRGGLHAGGGARPGGSARLKNLAWAFGS